MSSFSTPPASAFTIWQDWLNNMLANLHTELNSAAVRHTKMVGASITSTLMWVRTGSCGETSGVLCVMEHSGDTDVSPGVQGLVDFLKQLPDSVRKEIVSSLREL